MDRVAVTWQHPRIINLPPHINRILIVSKGDSNCPTAILKAFIDKQSSPVLRFVRIRTPREYAKHVGIGTDLDVGFGNEQTPMDLDSVTDLHSLVASLAAWAIREDIDSIFSGNFLRFLREHLR